MVTIADQIELLKPRLVNHLEHSFDGILDLPRAGHLPLTYRQVAMKEAETFIAFLRNQKTAEVRIYAQRQAADGLPTEIMFRLYATLRDFCQSTLNKEIIPTAILFIDSYCNAYADGYAEGRATWIGSTRTGTRWLSMAAEISSALGSILNPDELLNEAVDLIRKYSGCNSVALFLIDDLFKWATVQACSSEPGRINYPADYRLRIGDKSPVSQCITTGIAQVMLYGDGSLKIPETDSLTGIRSLIVLPLISHSQIIGAVSFHSEEDVGFDGNDQMRLRLTVDQIANAIENARLYRELASYADTLEELVQERTLEISQAKEYTEAILNNSPDAIVFLNTDGSIKTVNSAFCQLFHYKSDEVRDILVSDLAAPEYKFVVESALRSVLETGQVARFRMTALRRDSTAFDLDAALAPGVENGSINGVVCNLRDVTNLVRAEDLVKASLREKELLLQEIHHRVKNNLQVVASLISLQMSRIVDEAASQVLRESQTRIHTMALIHERLYRSGDLASVDFAEYVRELVNYVSGSYSPQSSRINVTVDVTKMALDLNTAIPCGLIINELVSNAFKHAFLGLPTGEIVVEIRTNEQSQCILSVRDNGVGFPHGIDPRSTSTLGLQLVQGLVGQLDGTLYIQSDTGATSLVINFPNAISVT